GAADDRRAGAAAGGGPHVTSPRACAPAFASALALALVLAGCGGSSAMSAQQLRAKATRACTTAIQQLDRIPTPRVPSQGATFLRHGIAALAPEVSSLAALHPDGDLGE